MVGRETLFPSFLVSHQSLFGQVVFLKRFGQGLRRLPPRPQSEVGSEAAPSMLALKFEGRDATESEIESQLERASRSRR